MIKCKAMMFSAVSGFILLFNQSIMATHYTDQGVRENSNSEMPITQKYIENMVKDKFQDSVLSTILVSDKNGSYYLVNTISQNGFFRSTRVGADTGIIVD